MSFPIEPAFLLDSIENILDPYGGIKHVKFAREFVDVMRKSEKLVPKCVYLNILRATSKSSEEVLKQILSLGGWNLLYTWLNDSEKENHWSFVKELLKVFLDFPLTLDFLKLNDTPKIIRRLSKRLDIDTDIRNLASDIVSIWKDIIVDEYTPTFSLADATSQSQSLSASSKSTNPVIMNNRNINEYTLERTNEIHPVVSYGHFNIQEYALERSNAMMYPPVSYAHQQNQHMYKVQQQKQHTSSVDPNIDMEEECEDLGSMGTNHQSYFYDQQQITSVNSPDSYEIYIDEDIPAHTSASSSLNRSHTIPFRNSASGSYDPKIGHYRQQKVGHKEKLGQQEKVGLHHRQHQEKSGHQYHQLTTTSSSSITYQSPLAVEAKKPSQFGVHRPGSTNKPHRPSVVIPQSIARASTNSGSYSQKFGDRTDSRSSSRPIKPDRPKITPSKLSPTGSDSSLQSKTTVSSSPGNLFEKLKPKEKSISDKSSSVAMTSSSSSSDKFLLAVSGMDGQLATTMTNENEATKKRTKVATAKTFSSKFRSTGLDTEPEPPTKKPKFPASSGTTTGGLSTKPTPADIIRATSAKRLNAGGGDAQHVVLGKSGSTALPSIAQLAAVEKKTPPPLPAPPPAVSDPLWAVTNIAASSVVAGNGTTSTSSDGVLQSSPTVITPPANAAPKPKLPPPKALQVMESDIFMAALEGNAAQKAASVVRKKKVVPKNNTSDSVKPAGTSTAVKSEDTLKTSVGSSSPVQKPIQDGKKHVQWAKDADLVQIQWFEVDESERVNVNRVKMFGDYKHFEMHREREALEAARRQRSMDTTNEEVHLPWKFIPVDGITTLVERGLKSQERATQADRQKNILAEVFFPGMPIPDTPKEPELMDRIAHQEPLIIPLEDVSSGISTTLPPELNKLLEGLKQSGMMPTTVNSMTGGTGAPLVMSGSNTMLQIPQMMPVLVPPNTIPAFNPQVQQSQPPGAPLAVGNYGGHHQHVVYPPGRAASSGAQFCPPHRVPYPQHQGRMMRPRFQPRHRFDHGRHPPPAGSRDSWPARRSFSHHGKSDTI